jgi:hypothetical protein
MSIRISRLLYELELAGFDCDSMSYRKVWQGAIERRYPARQIRGVWHFEPEDTPAIGKAYDLPLRSQPRKLRAGVTRARTSASAAA